MIPMFQSFWPTEWLTILKLSIPLDNIVKYSMKYNIRNNLLILFTIFLIIWWCREWRIQRTKKFDRFHSVVKFMTSNSFYKQFILEVIYFYKRINTYHNLKKVIHFMSNWFCKRLNKSQTNQDLENVKATVENMKGFCMNTKAKSRNTGFHWKI